MADQQQLHRRTLWCRPWRPVCRQPSSPSTTPAGPQPSWCSSTAPWTGPPAWPAPHDTCRTCGSSATTAAATPVRSGRAGLLDGHVQDLFAVLGDRPATVVGHSCGGGVALAAAARGPDQIRSVGAYEPPTPWTGWWRAASGDRSGSLLGDPADVAEAFLSRMIGAERWNRLPRSYRDQRRAEGEALTAELRSIENPTAPFDATELRVPVMIGRGREAGRRHGRACEDLVAAIPGAVLHVIEVAGHDAHASHPEAYADYVRLTVARGEGR
ncbi:MAG: alpha/beta hydrolase [Acidimicrobiales bacterium]